MTGRTLLHRHPSSAPAGGYVIAVASGKGGVGKTWFAITLAQALGRAGRRVLLFDGDLGLANVDIQLGLAAERDLGAVIAGEITLAAAVTRSAEAGIDIVAGRSGSGSLAGLPVERLLRLRAELFRLARLYDHAVVDLGAGVDQAVRALAASAGLCLVLASDEPTALTDAYAFIKLTWQASAGADIRIVVNMAADRAEGMRTYRTLAEACRNFLGLSPPLAGIVRADPRVRETIRHQTPMLTRYPTAEAASDVEAIRDGLLRAAAARRPA